MLLDQHVHHTIEARETCTKLQVKGSQLADEAHDLRTEDTSTGPSGKSSSLHDDRNALTCTFMHR
ncbi:hypothetical protein [Streptomyces sp. NBC_00038]|uniref:hypothetical protein n=1 Tax=Streptomyces sp. NBC_00038 TaxID=2903615 RepID=UPI0022538C56|nr:hypothetical protein [Streptomyces sp. NBC_00038]MCX5562730.1 hypothetical protein [Streptomyces sp. NBC_00038]MCX5563620.1 hypothetical protein [Streptomyces sp. NBC_00038]